MSPATNVRNITAPRTVDVLKKAVNNLSFARASRAKARCPGFGDGLRAINHRRS
jgi:hypothetical protein